MYRHLYTLVCFFSAVYAFGQTPCVNGMAGDYPCSNIDLVAYFSNTELGGNAINGNDVWGWTHPQSGREFALMSLFDGTAFVEIHSNNAVYLGFLPKHGGNSKWGDIRTYDHYAYIGSENSNQGIQIFDLNQLLNITEPLTFETTAQISIESNSNSSHNLSINESTGYLYVVGSDTCSGGIVFFDLSNPVDPIFAGCFAADGYTHDVICFIYSGPDQQYVGREICIASNEDSETIIDVTDKKNAEEISKILYAGSEYTHQSWVTDDQRFVIFDDELDEYRNGHNTRTHVLNIEDLDNPVYLNYYESDLAAIDHNQFIKGNLVFQSQYEAGLRILDISELTNDPANEIEEVAFFDTWPASNATLFNGNWGNYPFYRSGHVAVSNRNGLFILKPQISHFTLTTDKFTRLVCPNETIVYTIQSDTFAGFSDTLDLQIANLPNGVRGQFSSNYILAGQSVDLELTGIGSTLGSVSFSVGAESRNIEGYHNIALSYQIVNAPDINVISEETFNQLAIEYASEQMEIDNTSINLNATFLGMSPTFTIGLNTQVESNAILTLYNENICLIN